MKLPTDNIISCFYDSTNDCVKVIDTAGTLLSLNPKGYEVMEIDDPKTVIGTKWLELWSEDMLPKAQAAFNQALNGKMARFEGFCPTFKGTSKWWQVDIAPLKNEFNEVQWILAVSRDVSELRELKVENEMLKTQLFEQQAITKSIS
ncbi:MAG: PAS domain-containing protein [Candidatus Saccharimonadales bacterium]